MKWILLGIAVFILSSCVYTSDNVGVVVAPPPGYYGWYGYYGYYGWYRPYPYPYYYRYHHHGHGGYGHRH